MDWRPGRGWPLDLFLLDTRRSDSGHLAGLCRRRPGHPNDGEWRLRTESLIRRPVPVLSRSLSSRPGDSRYCPAVSRARSRRRGGTRVTSVFARFYGRSPTPGSSSLPVGRTSMRWMSTRFGDRRVTRMGRLGFRIPGSFRHMTVSRDGRWAVATNMVRFESDLMRLDDFR